MEKVSEVRQEQTNTKPSPSAARHRRRSFSFNDALKSPSNILEENDSDQESDSMKDYSPQSDSWNLRACIVAIVVVLSMLIVVPQLMEYAKTSAL